MTRISSLPSPAPHIGAVLSLTLILAVGKALAVPVSHIQLKPLTAHSDLICVGGIVSIRQQGMATIHLANGDIPASAMIATLRVERVLKGQLADETIDFGFVQPSEIIGYGLLWRGVFGVFFLGRSKGGYSVVDPYHPFVVAVPGTPPTAGTPFDLVIIELATATESSAATRDVRVLAVSTLDYTPGPEATAALMQGAESNDDEVRFRSIYGLLARNNLAYLDEAAGYLLNPPPSVNEELIEGMALGIRLGVKSPEAISTLGRLLQAQGVQPRRCAAMALRTIGTEAAVKPLTLALADSDREVRFEAIFGLARIAGETKWLPDE